MAKFSDLDPERQRQLVITLRCLERAIESLAAVCGFASVKASVKATRIQLLQQAQWDADKLSDRQIADLLRKLDELNVTDID